MSELDLPSDWIGLQKWSVLRNGRCRNDFDQRPFARRDFSSIVGVVRREFRWMIFDAVQFEELEDDPVVHVLLTK